MNVNKYALKFIQLSRYDPAMVTKSREKMCNFVSGVSKIVVK